MTGVDAADDATGKGEGQAGRSQSRHGVRRAALGVGVLVIGLAVAIAIRPPSANQPAPSPLLGHPAPPVPGPSVTPVAFASLSERRGRWTLVNFFATWCVPCRKEQPELVRFADEHRATTDVGLVMVVYNDSTPAVQAFLGSRGGDWPAVQDAKGVVALDFGVTGIPETYIVDPAGLIVGRVVGGSTAEGLDHLLHLAQSRGL